MPSKQPHAHRLSAAAHEDLNLARAAIDELRPTDGWPSASIVVEFLVWHFWATRGLEGAPHPNKFRQKTQRGKPRERADRPDNSIRPQDIRKLAGVDPITTDRKLR